MRLTEDGFRSPVGCTAPAVSKDDAFVAWCASERVLFPSSQLRTLQSTGRALVASRNIMMGEVVVEVPDSALVSLWRVRGACMHSSCAAAARSGPAGGGGWGVCVLGGGGGCVLLLPLLLAPWDTFAPHGMAGAGLHWERCMVPSAAPVALVPFPARTSLPTAFALSAPPARTHTRRPMKDVAFQMCFAPCESLPAPFAAAALPTRPSANPPTS